MKVLTSNYLVDPTLMGATLRDGDSAFVVMPSRELDIWDLNSRCSIEQAVKERIPLMVIGTTIGIYSHPELYKYFTTKEIAERYCNLINMGANLLPKAIKPKKVEAKAKVLTATQRKALKANNYDKAKILALTGGWYNLHSYYSTYRSVKTFKEREAQIDKEPKIKFSFYPNDKVRDLSDIFWLLISQARGTLLLAGAAHTSIGRLRSPDDLYLLAKYQYGIDISYEECYKIVAYCNQNRAKANKNWGLNLSFCSTVHKLVTSSAGGITQEQLREFFNNEKLNLKITKNG